MGDTKNLSTPEGNANVMGDEEYDPTVAGSAPHDANALIDTVAEEMVTIYPAAGKSGDTARALLEAAGDDWAKVKTSDGNFVVPRDIAERANVPEDDEATPTPKPTASKSRGRGAKGKAEDAATDDDGNGADEPDSVVPAEPVTEPDAGVTV